MDKQSLCCGVIYKPPNVHCTALCSLEDTITQLLPVSANIVCMGDFNINMLSDGPDVEFLKNISEAYNLHQIINSPTRVFNNSSSLIDLFFVSSRDSICKEGVVELQEISDHFLIYALYKIDVPRRKKKTIIYRDIKNIDRDQFAVKANSID